VAVTVQPVQDVVVDIDVTRQHAYNQASVRLLRDGDLLAVYNEERWPFHHDSGQTVMIRSRDAGRTWGDRRVVLPYTDTQGNWDCGICELPDGTLLVNLTLAGYFQRGITPEQPSWSHGPRSAEHGDWTWSYRLMGWLGTAVLRSTDGGATWSEPIPVNARPLTHAGCRLGCWPVPGHPDSVLMGVYGRIKGFGEEGQYETTRSTLLRSDDGGRNWEYFSTMAFDAAAIVDYEEPAICFLDDDGDGRVLGVLRTHVNPSGDAKNMAVVTSDDGGFSWSLPRFTNIWGYPAEILHLHDGRYCMIYGYRRPPYGVRGCLSDGGVHWDVANEFVVREGGVPRDHPKIGWDNPGGYQHIGYPSAQQLADGTIVVLYHEWDDARPPESPIQYIRAARVTL
jgi:hypothetical protein